MRLIPVLGLTFLLLGGALLLQELGQFTLNWTYVLALIVSTVGAVVMVSGLVGVYRSRRRTPQDAGQPLAPPPWARV